MYTIHVFAMIQNVDGDSGAPDTPIPDDDMIETLV